MHRCWGEHTGENPCVISQPSISGRTSVRDAEVAAPLLNLRVVGDEVADGPCTAKCVVEVSQPIGSVPGIPSMVVTLQRDVDQVDPCQQGEVKFEQLTDRVKGYGFGEPCDADRDGVCAGTVSER